MDSYVKNITIDVNAEDNYTMVKAKQGDKINRKIAITLKKDGANFTPSGVSQIWFRMEKPDSNIVIVKSTDSGSPISVNENVYTVDLVEQCLTASGEAWCDLAFLDASGNTLSSAAFVMKIIPMPNGDSARSSSAWTDLQEAIDDAERFASILAFRVNNGYIQYTVDSETWINLMPSSSVGSPDSDTVPNRSNVSGETVTDALDNLNTYKASLASPSFTGTPTTPTPESSDDSTKVANTEWVRDMMTAENITYDETLPSHASGSAGEKLSELNSDLNTLESDLETLRENLATVETGNTASRAYSIDELVVVGGILYKVTSAIASGGTFTIGTNIRAVTVGAEITGLRDWIKHISYFARILIDPSSKLTYTFNVTRENPGNYANFLICGSTSASGQFFYVGFVNTQANGSGVSFSPIIAGNRTFTATYDETTLTITGSDTVWGGIRLIWLA